MNFGVCHGFLRGFGAKNKISLKKDFFFNIFFNLFFNLSMMKKKKKK